MLTMHAVFDGQIYLYEYCALKIQWFKEITLPQIASPCLHWCQNRTSILRSRQETKSDCILLACHLASPHCKAGGEVMDLGSPCAASNAVRAGTMILVGSQQFPPWSVNWLVPSDFTVCLHRATNYQWKHPSPSAIDRILQFLRLIQFSFSCCIANGILKLYMVSHFLHMASLFFFSIKMAFETGIISAWPTGSEIF